MSQNLESFVVDLGHSRADFRRDALAAIEPHAAGFLPPSATGALRAMAFGDPEEELRRRAALAFLTQIWRFHDFRRAVPLLAAAELADLTVLVEEPRPAEKVAPRLWPLVERALENEATRHAALHLLEPLERFGADLGAYKPRLIAALAQPTERVRTAEVLRRLRVDLAPHADVLAALLADRDRVAQQLGASFLVRHALVASDATWPLRLLRDDRVVVREAAAAELHAAARAGVDVRVAIEALGVALSDSAGGVALHAQRALLAAASSGVDLAPVVADLARRLRVAAYALDGWTEAPTGLQRADVTRESPAADAMRTLLLHHLQRGEAAAVDALLQRDDLDELTAAVAQETVAAALEAPEFAHLRKDE